MVYTANQPAELADLDSLGVMGVAWGKLIMHLDWVKCVSVSESFLPALIQDVCSGFKYPNDHFQLSDEAQRQWPQWFSWGIEAPGWASGFFYCLNIWHFQKVSKTSQSHCWIPAQSWAGRASLHWQSLHWHTKPEYWPPPGPGPGYQLQIPIGNLKKLEKNLGFWKCFKLGVWPFRVKASESVIIFGSGLVLCTLALTVTVAILHVGPGTPCICEKCNFPFCQPEWLVHHFFVLPWQDSHGVKFKLDWVTESRRGNSGRGAQWLRR